MALKDDYNGTGVDITGGLIDAPLGTRSAQTVVASPLISRDAAYLGSYTVLDGKLIIAYLQGTLPSAMASTDTSYDFQREMTEGDFLLLRWGGQFEYITVGALDSGTTYAITRDSTTETWGALDWPLGMPYVVLGAEGAGRLELSAEGGAPKLRIISQGATADAETTLGVLGELNGHYGITTSTIGLGLGVSNGTAAPTGAVLTVDPTNGAVFKTAGSETAITASGITLGALPFGGSYSGPKAIKWADESVDVAYIYTKEISDGVYAIWLFSDSVKVDGYVELNSNVTYAGALKSAKNSTTYTGYIYIPLAANLTAAAFDGDSFSDVSWTKIDTSAVFSAPAGIKAAMVRLIARDSTTWGTAGLYARVGPDGSATSFAVRPAGGDVWAEVVGVCPCNADGDFYYDINASGSNTLDLYIEIMGYYI